MIQEIEDRFRVMKRLGAATNSQILIAKDRQSGQDVVIKVFNGTSVPHEVQVLYSLCHPSIVSIYQTFSTQNGTFCMAMPMLGKREMDLFEYVEECGPLPEKSDENVIIDPDTMTVQLIDFESARPINDIVGLQDTTISYAPPEVYSAHTANTLVAKDLDCWCLGVLLFTLMHSRSPFSSSYDAQACIVNIDRSRHSQCTCNN